MHKFKKISDEAFWGKNLTNVSMSNSVTYIGDRAFSGNQLTNVTIPDSVDTIMYNAFSENKLTDVIIGSNVIIIEIGAFAKTPYSNSNLTTITNKTGKAFDWGYVINDETGYNFETSTVVNSAGNVEIIK